MSCIRPCRDDERGAILTIVNAAAEAYRGVIPADRWHEPQMVDSATGTAGCTRLAAQDRHGPKESVPLALSTFDPRRGRVGRLAIHAHLTAPAAESTIYMPAAALDAEIASGVVFWGCEADGTLVGVMGSQAVRDVDLIRHAYVAPAHQGRGIGGALLEHLKRRSTRRTLVGTWAAAEWAIRFYERHGFERVGSQRAAVLLEEYWTIPERQVATSVVLAWRPAADGGADRAPP